MLNKDYEFNKKTMTQLSTQVFTHLLKIKGFPNKPITEKFAKHIYDQLVDPNTKTVVIANPETLTHITRYKNDIELVKLWEGENMLEDMMHTYWLKEHEKDHFRKIWEDRKKERKSTSNEVMEKMLQAFINKQI